jgi:hypothetical protein
MRNAGELSAPLPVRRFLVVGIPVIVGLGRCAVAVNYVWVAGCWAVVPGGGYVWAEGHWRLR